MSRRLPRETFALQRETRSMNSVSNPAALASLEVRLLSLRPDARRRWGILDVAEMLAQIVGREESRELTNEYYEAEVHTEHRIDVKQRQ